MWREHISVCMLFAAAFPSLCCADVTKFATANSSDRALSAADRSALQDSSRFHEVHSTHDLPPAIVGLCGSKLADPGQKWNATDVIMDATLPGKRLIWAAIAGEYYVLHYERGGIAHTYHVLAAKLANNDSKPKVVWSAMGGPFKNYAAFVEALRNGKLDDRLDYGR